VRHSYFDVTDPLDRLHEAWHSQALRARIVLALSAVPVFGRDEPLLPGMRQGAELHGFRVEAYLREGESMTLLAKGDLTAAEGSDAELSFGQLGGRDAPPIDPSHRLGAGVTVKDLAHRNVTPYMDEHRVEREKADASYAEEHAVELGDEATEDFLREHRVKLDRAEGPTRTFTIKQQRIKLSKKKREKLRTQAQIAAAQEIARERARTLPGGEDLPEGFQRETVRIRIRVLHASRFHVQAEIHLEGHVRLPGESEATRLTATFVEELERGEPLEIGLAELARGGEPMYDHVFLVTALP
jgi:hypothetical protein